jgi:hypothetical protein
MTLIDKAILSMPFFTSTNYMQATSRFWIWIVLTVPCTAFLFLFFIWWKMRKAKRAHHASLDQESVENCGEKKA